MFLELSPADRPKGRISGSSSKNSSELVSIPFMSLDLTPGAGNLLDEFYWEILSPWRGGSSIVNTGPAPPSGAAGSILWSILEEKPHPKYYLTRKACLGIIRRASERGKPLPEQLQIALEIQAGIRKEEGGLKPEEPVTFTANQRDEVRDLHDVAGALAAQPGMKQQTFVAAGFCAESSKNARWIGYQEECAPTLKAVEKGPTVWQSPAWSTSCGESRSSCELGAGGESGL